MIVVGLVREKLVMIEFKGSHFEREVILWGVRWYVAYPISYRQLEEMMEERGVEVDHATLNRWVLKYVPQLEVAFRVRKTSEGKPIITDMQVEGIWLALSQRSDFTAFLQQHNGSVQALTDDLKRQTAQLSSASLGTQRL